MNMDTTAQRARWKDSLGQAIAACHDRQREDVRAVVELANRFGTPAPAILPMVRASLARMDRDEERRAWMAGIEVEVGSLPEAEARALVAPVAVLAANRSWYLPNADVLNLINAKA